MEFKKINLGFKIKGSFDEINTDTHLSSMDNDLTNEEIEFELEEKINLINKLFDRYDVDEDTPPTHLV